MSDQDTSSKRSDISNGMGCLIVILVLVGIFGAIRLANTFLDSGTSSERVGTTAIRTRNPVANTGSTDFREVRNDCGMCGTNSPVGGWETGDGRVLILAQNKNFSLLMTDGRQFSGTWELDSGELCLTDSISDGTQCLAFQQKVDAMKFGSAIYIRR